jgi:hypothetical protein
VDGGTEVGCLPANALIRGLATVLGTHSVVAREFFDVLDAVLRNS